MVLGIIKLLGVVIFLYLIWRNLYEDYRDDLLISYAWSSVLILLLGGRFVFGILNWGVLNDSWLNWFLVWKINGYSFYGGLLSVMLWTWWYCSRNGWKLWSFAEDIIPIYYLMLAFMLGEEYVRLGLNIRSLIGMLVCLGAYILANYLKGRYRSITWYKSGKKGFIFFFVNMFVLGVLAVVSILYKDGLILVISSIILSLIFGLGLVILGDVLNISIGGRKVNGSKI